MTFPAVIVQKWLAFVLGDFTEIGNRPLDILIMPLRQILMAVVTDKVSEFG